MSLLSKITSLSSKSILKKEYLRSAGDTAQTLMADSNSAISMAQTLKFKSLSKDVKVINLLPSEDASLGFEVSNPTPNKPQQEEKDGKIYILDTDATRKPLLEKAGWAAVLFDSDRSKKIDSTTGTFEYHKDTVRLEMSSVIEGAKWVKESHSYVNRLEVYNDSKQAVNYLKGVQKVQNKASISAYKRRIGYFKAVQEKFQSFSLHRKPREEMPEVSNLAGGLFKDEKN